LTIQTGIAQSGTIYINPDGSIISPVWITANITTSDNVTYTFTGSNYLPIVVNRSNIIINGMGHTLQASWGTGIDVAGTNVTIKNTTITNCYYGTYLSSSGDVLSGNNVRVNIYGIYLGGSDSNTLSGNNITSNIDDGIDLGFSSGNVLSSNNVTADGYGIFLEYSSGNNILSGNTVTANSGDGIYLDSSSGNVLSGNNVTENSNGIYLYDSSDSNTLSGNNITANSYDGIGLFSSSGNTFYHNNFNNTQQVSSDGSPNTWDNGYPSGGNYWSDYQTKYPNASEVDSSAIWNASYYIDASNIDRYPLMGPFHTFGVGTWNGTAYSVDTVSNSTITDLNFSAATKTLSFNVSGANGTTGFCRVAIPLSLMSGEWTVTVNGTQPQNLNITTYGNYTYVYFTYHHSTETVQIQSTSAIPEFQSYMLLPLLMMITLLITIASKKKRKVAHVTKPAKESELL
jgi:parallel beta-helix repeat protein